MLLQLDGVSKIYQMEEQTVTALNDISLKIHEGEHISIMGPSGSGKSTLLHIMSLLDVPTHGKVIFKDKQVEKFSEKQLAYLRNREIGFVFQQFNLLPKVSAWENVALPLVYANVEPGERKARAIKMLEKVGLGDRLENTRSQLSGGQQQRVAIARALINKPSIIFADEPTGNLDSKSGDEVLEIFEKLHEEEGTTVVLVTHEPGIAAQANRHIVIKDGKILSDSDGHWKVGKAAKRKAK
jgi:putative ABC transport system ATP-binding protein